MIFAQRLKDAATQLGAIASSNAADALLLIGTGLLSYGAWLVYVPAGYITGGILCLVAGIAASRAE